jgi:hypothetical protein
MCFKSLVAQSPCLRCPSDSRGAQSRRRPWTMQVVAVRVRRVVLPGIQAGGRFSSANLLWSRDTLYGISRCRSRGCNGRQAALQLDLIQVGLHSIISAVECSSVQSKKEEGGGKGKSGASTQLRGSLKRAEQGGFCAAASIYCSIICSFVKKETRHYGSLDIMRFIHSFLDSIHLPVISSTLAQSNLQAEPQPRCPDADVVGRQHAGINRWAKGRFAPTMLKSILKSLLFKVPFI